MPFLIKIIYLFIDVSISKGSPNNQSPGLGYSKLARARGQFLPPCLSQYCTIDPFYTLISHSSHLGLKRTAAVDGSFQSKMSAV